MSEAAQEFRDIDVELLDHQYDALTSENAITLLKGGIGSGKSFCGALHCLDMAETNPDAPGLIAANTYKQLQDATLTTLLTFLDKHKIRHAYKKQANELYIGRKMFFCRSLENYRTIAGIQISDGWLDETRDTKPEAFDVVIGRMRHPDAKRFRLLLTTSPNGYDWLHDKFVANPFPGTNMVEATSMDNTFLPPDYIPMLMAAYDEKMIRQEVYGEFINLTANSAYYCFSRSLVREFPHEDNPYWGGIDFNVDPMTGVIGWVKDDIIYIWDEAFLRDSNTPSMRRHLLMKGYSPATLVPDGTGKGRKTSSETGITDHILLAEGGDFDIKRIHNPYVGDRINCVNGLLEKARIVIHPRCVNLIKDLEQVARGDKNDKMLTHISDALGYLCWYLYPITRMNKVRQYKY